jgi:acyl-coenzyme A thioesterase PaaI-like protein
MQGGMIATAIDNAFGPLSLLIAPPNVTRHLEIKYKKPVTLYYSYIFVKAKVKEVKNPYIYLSARVESETEELFALAKAVNYILPMNK